MDSLENMKTIERAVYTDISACLDSSLNESIEITHTEYNFILPNGLSKLQWPKGSVVDVKYRLAYSSFERIKEQYDKNRPPKLIVIVDGEELLFITKLSNILSEGRNIELIPYSKFKTLISTIPVEKKDSHFIDVEKQYRNEERINRLNKVKDAIRHNKISIFLGAGVSASAGVVTWDSLLEQLCVKKRIVKIDGEIDNVIKGRLIVDEYKNAQHNIPNDYKKVLAQDIREILYAHVKSSELISAIVSLISKSNIESIISYNYDNLVEEEIIKNNKQCYHVYDKDRPKGKDIIHIYHVHGYVSRGEEYSPVVLGEQEYHKIFQESYNWGNVEQLHALCRSTCLFIGLSMKDPNLRRLIDISTEGSEIEPIHYAFLRKVDHNIPLTEKQMRGFGINCIWYDNHEDLPKIIKDLVNIQR